MRKLEGKTALVTGGSSGIGGRPATSARDFVARSAASFAL